MVSIFCKIAIIIYFQFTSPLLLPKQSIQSSTQDLGSYFGMTIASEDGVLFTNANRNNIDESMNGVVYAFDENSLNLLCTFNPESETSDSLFGSSIAVDDGIVAIGAKSNSDKQPKGGAVHLYDLESGQQLHKIYLPNAEPNDQFGSSVDMDNGILVVGAGDADYDHRDSGVAVIIDVESGEILHTLFPEDSTPFVDTRDISFLSAQRSRIKLGFGKSVAIEGDLIAISAPHESENGENSGAVYLYDASTGKQLNKITEPVLEPSRLFGFNIELSNGLLLISAPYTLDNDPANPRYYRQYWGSVYVYEASTGRLLYRLEPSFNTSSFGYRIEIEDNLIAVAPQGSGSFFRFSPTIFLFDARSGQEIAQLNIPGITSTALPFGLSLSDSHISIGIYTVNPARNKKSNGSIHIFDRPELD